MEFSRGFGVRWLGLSLLAGWLVLGCLWQPAWGQPDFFWNAGSGDWGTATNWNPPTGPPNATQNAFLESNDAISRTVTFNNIYGAGTILDVIRINAQGTGTMTLELGVAAPAGDLGATTVYVGDTGQGAMQQSNGTANVTAYLYLGNQVGSSGTYNLTGGDLSALNLVVGEFGTGFLTQSENTPVFTNTMVTGDLTLGANTGGNGTYNLQGGNLLTNFVFVGHSSTGTFLQSGGLHAVAGELSLGYVAGSNGTYELSGSGALATNFTTVGYGGTGVFNQSGGGHLVGDTLTLGMSAGSSGTYLMTGGALTAANAYIGDGGSGTFTQGAGTTVAVTNGMGVGRGANSNSTYNLNGGTLDIGDAVTVSNLWVGALGTGTFNQAGGTPTITGNIVLGEGNTGNGTYNLQVGTLAANNLDVGQLGIGTFNQSAGTTLNLSWMFINSQAGTSVFTQTGGTTNVANHLGVGRDLNSHAEYNLQGGSLTVGDLYVGHDGTGTFNQTGGTHNVNGDVWIGNQTSGNGTYVLQNGNLADNRAFVGFQGTGLFNQGGGTHAVTTTLTISGNPGTSSGRYNLSGGSLTANMVDLNAGGIFNQTGGSLNVTTFNHQGGEVQGSLENRGTYNYNSGTFTGRLLNYGTANFNADFTAGNGMANFAAHTLGAGRTLTLNGQGLEVDQGGTWSQTGGSLSTANTTVGNTGSGGFTQSGGTHTVGLFLDLGANQGSTGTYNLQDGTLNSTTPNIGNEGTGIFTQSGGTHTVGYMLNLGTGNNGSGTYHLQGGSVSTGYLNVGVSGAGLFNQSNTSTLNIASWLYVGENPGSQGEFRLQGGTVASNELIVGQGGTGTFNQTGGVANPNHTYVGREAGSSGTYHLDGGNLNTGDLYVGNAGTGTWFQNGGTPTFGSVVPGSGFIYLGNEATGQGTYNLQAGDLTANMMWVGVNGVGIFNQSAGTTLNLAWMDVDSQAGTSIFTQAGGTTNVTSGLTVAGDLNSHGEYNLQGGALNVNSLGIGSQGTGLFRQTGGALNVTFNVVLGSANGNGTYILQDGGLTSWRTIVGQSGSGLFNQSGGTHTVGNVLTLSGTPGVSTGTYNLSNGALNANNIDLNAGGIFNQTGGTLTATVFNQQGGEVQGSLENRGTYNYNSGTFTGRLLNFGTANFNADFTAGNGMANYAAHTLGAGRNLTLNGQGLEVDQGGLWLQTGGSLAVTNSIIGNNGVGTLTQSGGTHTLSGILTLAANLGSAGTYNLQGGTLTVPTITVNPGGLFNFTGGSLNYITLNLPGGTFQGDLDNLATLTGSGLFQGNLINRGTINPGNSPGTLNVAGSFTQAATGTYLLEIASATNYDQINITGTPGTASLSGTLTPVLLGGYQPAQNQLFANIISATGGVTGTFTTVTNPQSWRVLYYADHVDLMAYQYRNFVDASLNLSGNQQSLGAVLNSLAGNASGDLAAVLNALTQLPDSQVGNAMQQLTPDKGAALPSVTMANSLMQWRSLSNRLTFLRSPGGSSAGGSSLGGGLGLEYSRLSGLMLAYNGASLGSLLRTQPDRAVENPWGLFTNFVGTLGSQATTANQTGYDYNTFGFNSGLDYRFREDLVVGLGSGYYHTSTGFKGSGGTSGVNSIPFYVYGAYYPGPFYLMGSLGYTLNIYNLERQISFGGINRKAKSSFTGNQFNVSGEAGYDIRLKGLIFTPAANLNFSQVWVPAYTENGADAMNLRVAAQTADSLQTGVGARVTVPFKMGESRVIPQVSAFYQHEFANNSRSLNTSLSQAGGPFTFKTDAPGRDFAVLGAGVDVGVKKNLFIQANYNAEVGRRHSTAHYINAGVRWEF